MHIPFGDTQAYTHTHSLKTKCKQRVGQGVSNGRLLRCQKFSSNFSVESAALPLLFSSPKALVFHKVNGVNERCVTLGRLHLWCIIFSCTHPSTTDLCCCTGTLFSALRTKRENGPYWRLTLANMPRLRTGKAKGHSDESISRHKMT